ncbi:MAG: hypothetical protein ACE5R6_20325 [Candidatus Heimdallarchaeota archaeon]
MIGIILGILGIGVASTHFPPPAMALITIMFASLDLIWLMRQKVGARLVCVSCGAETAVLTVNCGLGIPEPEDGKHYYPCEVKVTWER